MALVATSPTSDTALRPPNEQLPSQRYADRLMMATFAVAIAAFTLGWLAILTRTAVWLIWQ